MIQIDDTTLFLCQYTNYNKDLDLYNIIPDTYFEYQKHCFENGIAPCNQDEFLVSFMIWFNKNIFTKN